jgi:hypothetical protein
MTVDRPISMSQTDGRPVTIASRKSVQSWDILAVRLMQLGGLVKDRLVLVGWIECPPRLPALVECAFGAVEVTTHVLTFSASLPA